MSQYEVYKFLKKHKGWFTSKEISEGLNKANHKGISRNLSVMYKYHELDRKTIRGRFFIWRVK